MSQNNKHNDQNNDNDNQNNDPEVAKLNKILANKKGGFKVLSLGNVVLDGEGWTRETFDEVYYTDGYDVIKTNPPGPDGRYLQYRFEISRRNNAPWFKSTKTILPHRPGEENEVAEDEDIRDVIAATTVIGNGADIKRAYAYFGVGQPEIMKILKTRYVMSTMLQPSKSRHRQQTTHFDPVANSLSEEKTNKLKRKRSTSTKAVRSKVVRKSTSSEETSESGSMSANVFVPRDEHFYAATSVSSMQPTEKKKKTKKSINDVAQYALDHIPKRVKPLSTSIPQHNQDTTDIKMLVHDLNIMKRVVNKSTHQYDFVAAESAELREMVEARDHTIATLTQTVNAIQDQLNKLEKRFREHKHTID